MDNIKQLELLIQSVMSELELRGYGRTMIMTHKKVFRELQLFYKSINETEYTEHIGRQFVEYVKRCTPAISAKSFYFYSFGIERLNCVLNGNEWRRFRPIKRDYAKSCYNNLISEYESHLMRVGKSKKAVRRCILIIADFLAFAERKGYTQINEFTADIILIGFEQATCKVSFRNHISAFLKYVYSHEMTKSNLRYLIPSVAHHYGVPSVYSPEEVEQLLTSINRATAIGKRDYAIILIAARLGLRASDIANLKFSNLKAGKIEIIQVKTKQPLTTILSDEIKDAIFDYVDHGRQQITEPCIFLKKGGYGVITADAIGALTRKAFFKSGIHYGNRKIGPHSLRASLATALLTEGNDYHAIQKVLGHQNIQSTKSYAKADIEQLRINAIPVPPLSGNLAKLLIKEACVQ